MLVSCEEVITVTQYLCSHEYIAHRYLLLLAVPVQDELHSHIRSFYGVGRVEANVL